MGNNSGDEVWLLYENVFFAVFITTFTTLCVTD